MKIVTQAAAASSFTRYIAVAFAWTAIGLYLLSRGEQFPLLQISSPQERTLAIVIFCLWSFLESSAIASLILLSRTPVSQYCTGKHRSSPIALLSLFITFSYLMLCFTSWAVYVTNGCFLTRDLVALGMSQPVLFSAHLTAREILLLSVLALCAAGTVVLLRCAMSPHTMGRVGRLCSIASPIMVFALFARIFAGDADTPSAALRAKVTYSLSPGLSLFVPNKASQPYALDTQQLAKRIAVADFAGHRRLQRSPRNIILISVESLRADAARQVEVMPTLARLAADGFSFERVYSQSNESSHSMTSLVQGLYPAIYPTSDNLQRMLGKTVRVYDLLSEAGYRTGFFSSANENWAAMIEVTNSPLLHRFFHSESGGHAPELPMMHLDRGFVGQVRAGNLSTGKLDDRITLQQLQTWLDETRLADEPFFAMLALQGSHFPYEQGFDIPAKFTPNELSHYDQLRISMADMPEDLRLKMRNRYFNSLHHIDGLINELMHFLETRDTLSSTTVIITGDHGEMFGEHGQVTHGKGLVEAGVRVPLIVWNSGRRGTLSAPAMNLDIAPTILALAGLPTWQGFQGSNLLDISNEALNARPIFISAGGFRKENAVVLGPWKYIDRSYAGTAQLFDIVADAGENFDLSLAFPSIRDCLRETLNTFVAQQSTYYQDPELILKYFAPRADRLPPACQFEQR